MNFAGVFYNAGNAAQFVMGMVIFSPREIASSVILVIASFCFMLSGHKKFGVPAGCSMAFFGVLLAAWPGLADLEAGTIFGVAAIIPSIMFGIFSAPLRKKYQKNRNELLAQTLGHPRRVMGLTALFLTRLPIILEDAIHARWDSLTLFSIWALADLTASLSDI